MASANSASAAAAAAAAAATTTAAPIMADSNHSPRRFATDSNSKSQAVGSPQSRRARGAVSSPWTQIVRGESETTIAATPSSPSAPPVNDQTVVSAASSSSSTAEEEGPEAGSGPGGNAVKKPAWKKPSNGAIEIGPVMGAASWPALAESARGSTKSSTDSPKGLCDGSSTSSVPQGTGIASPSSQKQVSNNSNPSSTPNHTLPARQRSMKRNGANTSSNGGAPQSPGSQGPVGEVHLNNSSPRDSSQRNPQPRGTNDHPQQQRNSLRNRNGGPHSRGDGSHHHNLGGRRDQDRSNQDWNNHRYFNGRDSHMHSQRVVPRFMRHPPPPPPASTPFIAPSPVRHFGSPIGFPELAPSVYYVAAPPPDYSRGLPFVAAPIPPHPMLFPVPDLQLHSKIVTQIDYYFSNENLVKDTFLRQNMDEQGWVPVKLIAGFNKVSQLTNNIQLILDAVRSSIIVEVQGDKLRRRNDWMRWIMPPSVHFRNVLSPQSLGNSSDDMVAPNIQSLSLEEKAANHSNVEGLADLPTEALLGSSSSRDLNSESDLSSGMGMGQVSAGGTF